MSCFVPSSCAEHHWQKRILNWRRRGSFLDKICLTIVFVKIVNGIKDAGETRAKWGGQIILQRKRGAMLSCTLKAVPWKGRAVPVGCWPWTKLVICLLWKEIWLAFTTVEAVSCSGYFALKCWDIVWTMWDFKIHIYIYIFTNLLGKTASFMCASVFLNIFRYHSETAK